MNLKTLAIALAYLIILAASSCNREKQGGDHKDIITLTSENFEDETSTGVILVDFWATWCIPCKAMSPVINEIAAQTKGRVKVCKVDVDQCGELATKFRVTGIPNFIILKDGKEVENLVGIQSKETLVHALQKHVNLQ